MTTSLKKRRRRKAGEEQTGNSVDGVVNGVAEHEPRPELVDDAGNNANNKRCPRLDIGGRRTDGHHARKQAVVCRNKPPGCGLRGGGERCSVRWENNKAALKFPPFALTPGPGNLLAFWCCRAAWMRSKSDEERPAPVPLSTVEIMAYGTHRVRLSKIQPQKKKKHSTPPPSSRRYLGDFSAGVCGRIGEG